MEPKTLQGFRTWATAEGEDGEKNVKATDLTIYKQWERYGYLTTSVKNTANPPVSRKVKFVLPLPVDAHGHLIGDGQVWYDNLIERMKQDAVFFLINSTRAKEHTAKTGVVIEYDSQNKHIYAMLRKFVKYWTGVMPPHLRLLLPPSSDVSDDNPPANDAAPAANSTDNNPPEDTDGPPVDANPGDPAPPVTDPPPLEPNLPSRAEAPPPEPVTTQREVPPPTHIWVGTSGMRIRVPVTDFPKASLLLGDTGSGKTMMLKHVMEACIDGIPSMTSYVVFDYKGDLVQLMKANPAHPDHVRFDERVQVNVYTFGTDMGMCASLDPFFRVDAMQTCDPRTIRGRTLLGRQCKEIAYEVLAGTVTQDIESHARLEGGFDLPSRAKITSTYGMRTSDEKIIATGLLNAVSHVFYKCRAAGATLPRSYKALLAEVKCAMEPRCADGTPADEILSQVIDETDLKALGHEISVRMSPMEGLSMLYEPARGDEMHPQEGDVYPLTGATFFDPSLRTKPVKISVIALGLLGEGSSATQHKGLVVSTILRRIQEYAQNLGGCDKQPRAMVVVDEAAFVMPVTRGTTGNAATATVAVERMIKKDRDKGLAIVLASQRPLDINSRVRSIVTGLRLVGQFDAGKKDKELMIKEVLKLDTPAKTKQGREVVSSLKNKSFAAVTSVSSSVTAVRAPAILKRVHESSSAYVADDSPTHPIALYDQARKRRALPDDRTGGAS